ncbi:MAG: MFS transporter, partial [Victivallales bacterium]|nr:MFS transporter [Victivallales bacterium]
LYLHNSRGLPMSTVGLIFPVMGAGVMLGPPVAGWLVDHFGRKKIMQWGTFLRGTVFLSLALLAWLNAPFEAFATALFFSAGIGTFFQNASDAFLTDITTAKARPRAYSLIRVGTNIGWALGPIIGSFLARTPFALLFLITALLCFSGSAFVTWAIRETRPEPRDETGRAMPTVPFDWHSLHPTYLTMVLFSFVLFMLTSQLYTTLSVFSTTVTGISKNHLGMVYSINGIAIVFFQIPVTKLLDRKRAPGVLRLVMGAAFYGSGYFLVAFCHNALQTALAILVITFGEIIVQPAIYTAVSRMSPPYCIGRFMGIFDMMRGLGFAVGPYFGALLFDSYASRPVTLWGILASAAVIAGIGFTAVGMFGRRDTVDSTP